MKPYTHHFKPFTSARVAGIRLNRELGLQESRAALIAKKTRKKSTTSTSTSTSTTKKKKYKLNPQTRAALAAASPEVRAMFEGMTE